MRGRARPACKPERIVRSASVWLRPAWRAAASRWSSMAWELRAPVAARVPRANAERLSWSLRAPSGAAATASASRVSTAAA